MASNYAPLGDPLHLSFGADSMDGFVHQYYYLRHQRPKSICDLYTKESKVYHKDGDDIRIYQQSEQIRQHIDSLQYDQIFIDKADLDKQCFNQVQFSLCVSGRVLPCGSPNLRKFKQIFVFARDPADEMTISIMSDSFEFLPAEQGEDLKLLPPLLAENGEQDILQPAKKDAYAYGRGVGRARNHDGKRSYVVSGGEYGSVGGGGYGSGGVARGHNGQRLPSHPSQIVSGSRFFSGGGARSYDGQRSLSYVASDGGYGSGRGARGHWGQRPPSHVASDSRFGSDGGAYPPSHVARGRGYSSGRGDWHRRGRGDWHPRNRPPSG